LKTDEKMNFFTGTDIPVKNIVRKNYPVCSDDTPISSAAKILRENQCSAIIVQRNKIPVGIWTEKDASGIDFANLNSFDISISEFMSFPILSINENLSIRIVYNKMKENNVRHYLTIDDFGKITGLISLEDLVTAPAMDTLLESKTVSFAVKKLPLIVSHEELLNQVLIKLKDRNLDAFFVDYGDNQFGIMTQRDLVRLIAEKTPNADVGSFAVRPLISINDFDSLKEARDLLLKKNIRHLGVLNLYGKLIGLLSFSEILNFMELVLLDELKKAYHEKEKSLESIHKYLSLLEKVMDYSKNAIFMADESGAMYYINPAFSEITGYNLEEFLQLQTNIFNGGYGLFEDLQIIEQKISLAETGSWHGRVWSKKKNGTKILQELSLYRVSDDLNKNAKKRYIGIFNDMTENALLEDTVRKNKYFDTSTNLPNADYFTEELDSLLDFSKKRNANIYVLKISIVNIKNINYTYGEHTGNLVIQEVADILSGLLRDSELICIDSRVHFFIASSNILSPYNLQEFVNQIISQFSFSRRIGEFLITIDIKIGVSISPSDGESAVDLMSHAAIASRDFNREASDQFFMYSKESHQKLISQFLMIEKLKLAIKNTAFEVHYQPVYRISDRNIEFYEALARWKFDNEYISAELFIDIAEKENLIIDLGYVVFETICKDLSKFELNNKDIKISVNLSPYQMRDPSVIHRLVSIMNLYSVRKENIIFEITESELLERNSSVDLSLQIIKDNRIEIFLDDYGAGYSSLSYLSNFPVSTIKIDKKLLTILEEINKTEVVIESLVKIFHSLDKKVVAEGIETKEQMEMINRTGCEYLQGFLLGKPMQASEVFTS